MSSTRTKAVYQVEQNNDEVVVYFQEIVDYVLVDINTKGALVSLGFNDKPFDEMVTIRLSDEIDMKESSYIHKKTENKHLQIRFVKLKADECIVNFEHKFIEKKNHPKADPRGYQVKKPVKKDWDKIVATLDESEEEDGDANSALKKIYDQCDDDTRRAMEKSLYESNGTVLNMNWAEVGKGKVKPYESSDPDNFKGFNK